MSTENKFKKQTVTLKKNIFYKKVNRSIWRGTKKEGKEGKKQNIKRICNQAAINIV